MREVLQTVPIEKAVEGMVIGQDILSGTGCPFVVHGTVLSSGIIDSLIRKGVRTVRVVSDQEQAFTEDELRDMELACSGVVLSRFEKEPEDPLMQAVYRAALRIEAMERLENERENG